MLFILFLCVISLLSTVSTYQLPSESKTCLLDKGIDYDSVQYELENCVNDQMRTVSTSSATVDELDHTTEQNSIMHCVDAFESEVQDCLSNKVSNELMDVQIQAVRKRQETGTGKPNITTCVFNLASLKPKAKDCTVKLKTTLMTDCNLPEKGKELDYHWKPIGTESVNDYCKTENEKSLCTVVTFDEGCPDLTLLRKYREYFLCIYKTDTCKEMIDSNYIQILPLKSQPKRPWMKKKKSSVPAIMPKHTLYLLTLILYVQLMLYI